jgi:hypothetical protein
MVMFHKALTPAHITVRRAGATQRRVARHEPVCAQPRALQGSSTMAPGCPDTGNLSWSMHYQHELD